DLKIFPIDEMRIRPQAGRQIMEVARPVASGFRKLLDCWGTDLEREAPLEPLLQDRIDLHPRHQIEPREIRPAPGASWCTCYGEVDADLIKLVTLEPDHYLPPWDMSLEQTVSRLSHDIVRFTGILPLQCSPICDQHSSVAGGGAGDRDPAGLPVQVAICRD